jgi:uncharacterized protein YgiM (DUF1202 family)/DNA-binding transcriptional regulator YdaS (Cro superfamily)
MIARWNNRISAYALVFVLLALVALVALASPTLIAAPQAQTVPPPTEEPPTEVPRATATPNRDDDNDDDNDSDDDDDSGTDQGNTNPQPTPTPDQPATPTQGRPVGTATTAIVLAERLNVREGPGTNFPVLGVVLGGDRLTILEGNAGNSWWRICCTVNSNLEGWVSAPFIRLESGEAQATPATPAPTLATTGTPTATNSVTATTAMTATATTTTTAAATTTSVIPLDLVITQSPPSAWQGQEIELSFVITNNQGTALTGVALRNELPPQLAFVAASAAGAGEVAEEELAPDRFAFGITWPELAPGATLTATVQVQIQEDLPDGAVIDNLAVVSATGVEPYTVGISVGMPPTTLPTFQ